MERKHLNKALCIVLSCACLWASGKESTTKPVKVNRDSYKTEAGDCVTPSAQFDLDINNVRARLLTGGDMWWNFSDAKYEVPKGNGTGGALTALFAGAIWISGLDAGNNLKVAAQTYRQSGDDYWPGPLTNGNVDKNTCNKYDRFFSVLGANITLARAAYIQKGPATSVADIPRDVLAWPGKGNPYLATDPSLVGEVFNITDNLAPFYDAAPQDGIYDPVKGDYPVIPCSSGESKAYADQMVFWVFNDAGNIHSAYNGQSIGVQVNSLAFAFQTTNDVNNMTFYKYEITNKSANPLYQTYISQWSDPDLGCFDNDRVGCDTATSLGIVYNGTTPDPDCASGKGYGSQLPIIGIDFFEGPISDSGVQLGLSSFCYFTNGAAAPIADPSTAAQVRNYMTGFWADGTPFTAPATGQPGTGYNSPGGTVTKYIFPGNPSDISSWNDQSSGQPAGDRRMVQTSGPFTLRPGVAQYVTVGAVFVRPAGNGVGVPPNYLTSIVPADKLAQALFDGCFQLVDGPEAPTVKIRELENKIILNLVNARSSNNFGESYNQTDFTIKQIIDGGATGTNGDSTYTFEGYKVYQVASATVSATDLDDPTKALLVAQVDVKNGVSKIINFERDGVLGLDIPVQRVEGADNGISNTFEITQDLFATGSNKSLVNHKTYYYTAIAYAYNNYKTFNPDFPTAGGQKIAYLQGRSNFKIYSAIPHKPDPRNVGTVINSTWGEGVEVKRIEGKGNGGNSLQLTPETIEKILASGLTAFTDTLTYTKGNDPIGFKVTDPVVLKEADFELQFVEDTANRIGATTSWKLRDLTNGVTINSDRNLDRPYEQQITDDQGNDYGFSIRLGTPVPVYTIPANDPALGMPERYTYSPLPSSIEFQNPIEQWLSFVHDEGSTKPSNWIRSGTTAYDPQGNSQISKAAAGVFDDNWHYPENETPPGFAEISQDPERYFTDRNQVYDKILNGTWAPYCLTPNYGSKTLNSTQITNGQPPFIYGPGFKWRNYTQSQPPQNTLDKLASVDIVLTSDPKYWSQCIVFETGEDEGINQGANIAPNGKAPRKGQLRMAYSKFLDGNGNLYDNTSDTGRSYFPGYAINVETGERLNICFGESSDQGDQNGRDMLWNPTQNVYGDITFPGQLIDQVPYFGGKHFIYVMDTKYDGGAAAQRLLLDNYTNLAGSLVNIPLALRPLYRSLMWASIPYLSPGYAFGADANGNKFIPPSEVKIKLRVERPYDRMATNATSGIDSLPRYHFSTRGLGITENNVDVAKSALDDIRIVPNPYLAYSAYETDQNSSIVKITNLPNNCTITIYALDGTIIRKLSRAIGGVDPATNKKVEVSDGGPVDQVNIDNSINWDLKNDKSIPIASGIYLFHIEAPGLGQKTLKWFGAVRPADTSNF